MCLNQASFTNYIHGIFSIYLGDLTPIKVEGQGHVTLRLQGSSVTFTNVLHVPSLTTNLLSVSALLSKGCKVKFEKKCCIIYRLNGIYLVTGKQEKNLFHLSMSKHAFVTTGLPQALSIEFWHQCLGHLELENVQKLQDNSTGIRLDQTNAPTVCKPCLAGKQHWTPSHQASQRAIKQLELIHSDVRGPVTPTSAGGTKYWLTFTNGFTQETWICFMKEKLESLQKLQKFVTWIQQQSNQKVKRFRSNNKGKYNNRKSHAWFKESGIQ